MLARVNRLLWVGLALIAASLVLMQWPLSVGAFGCGSVASPRSATRELCAAHLDSVQFGGQVLIVLGVCTAIVGWNARQKARKTPQS
jgi:hypothetical protein